MYWLKQKIKLFVLQVFIRPGLWLANGQIIVIRQTCGVIGEARGYRTDALNMAPQLLKLETGDTIVLLEWLKR